MLMAYTVPTTEERKALFYWLKQCSSYTAWARMGTYYRAFVEDVQQVFTATQDTPAPTNDGPLIHASDMALTLKCYAAFEEALSKLKSGDKSVFKFIGYGVGAGYFCEGVRALGGWSSKTFAAESHGLIWPLMSSPYWEPLNQKYELCTSAWSEIGHYVMESRFTDMPADIVSMADMLMIDNEGFALVKTRRDLPDVPVPDKEVLIKTGASCPHSGIWEPVRVPFSDGFLGLFKKPLAPSDGQFPLDGCMNYLHAGSPAPTIGFEGDPNDKGRPTTWRLIWRDDRYEDGTVPEEERDYVFMQPQAAPVQPADKSPAPSVPLVTAWSGQAAPQAGHWAVIDDLQGRATLRAGEVLPQHKGQDVQWVWSGV
ncbi:Imm71 family immunity protein [Aquabacterium sp. A7-Y]|uniref:Imm71 family immunity protein n=1 Tax=Aquabacterium sp. A7-Y TaxID=1349605 RepID=UPI00223CA201|nr:Imm71 family immunity protein [Aquabacterium sp. A7-Y]MCW7538033.1 Imm71 family immunity protein [Aquabacterium sp. A7-Y]